MSRQGWWIGGALVLLGVIVTVFILTAEPTGDATLPEGTDTTTTSAAADTSTTTTSTNASASTSTSDISTSAPTTSAPTTSVATSPTSTEPDTSLPPATDPDAGVEEDGPVPLGQSLELGNWQIGVSAANLDAEDIVLGYVDFNDPPADGNVYVLVELTGEYLGGGVAQPVFEWKLEGPRYEHEPDGLECGVIPDSIYDVGDVFPGFSFAASVCFEVPEENAGPGLLMSLGLFDQSGSERFFDLTHPES